MVYELFYRNDPHVLLGKTCVKFAVVGNARTTVHPDKFLKRTADCSLNEIFKNV